MNPLELNIININMFWLLASDLASKYDVVDIVLILDVMMQDEKIKRR
jgi:hypothetical protein